MESDRTALEWELRRLTWEMSNDELRLILLRARKLMGEGRREYGPLDISGDSRSVEDFISEAFDEQVDRDFYLDMAMLKIQDAKKPSK